MRTAFLTSVWAPTATLALCYVISVAKGHSEAFMPFISDLDLFQPEDTIFTIGLVISAVAIMVTLAALFSHKREALASAGMGRFWRVLNLIALPIGLLAAGSTLLIGFAPWPEFGPLHVLLARSIFYNGVAWCVIQLLLEWRLGRKVPLYLDQLKLRVLPVVAAFIGLVGFIFFSAKAVTQGEGSEETANWEELRQQALSSDTYTAGSLSPMWDVAALFEWLMILAMIATLATYRAIILRPKTHRGAAEPQASEDQSSKEDCQAV